MESEGRDGDPIALLVADIYEAAGVLRRHGDRIAAAAGQTQARWQLMSVVSGGDWTVPMAAERLGMSRQAVQRVANEIVDDGLAEFRDNPHHRRSPFLHLTASGRRTLAMITTRARRSRDAMAGDLASVDTPRLRAGLRQFTAVMRQDIDPTPQRAGPV